MDPLDELMDQRRYRRVPCQSNARINIDGSWQNCPMIDLSGGGGSFRNETPPPVGGNVLVQLRALGIIRARVVRCWGQGFAVEFNAEDYDVGTLVDNLTMLANPGLFSPADPDKAQKCQNTIVTHTVAESGDRIVRPEIQADADAASGKNSDSPQLDTAGEAEPSKGKRRHPLRATR